MTRSKSLRPVWLALAVLAIIFSARVLVWAQACPVSGTTTGSITATDPTQTDRVFRDGIPSDCNGKPFPGTFGSGVYHYDQNSFLNNSGAAVCIEVTFSATTNMHSVAYLNTFNPADVSQNYLGDLGGVNTPNTPETYSVSVPNGATLVIVTHEATVNGGGNYSFTLNCITAPPPLANQPGQLLISELRLAGPGAGAGSQRDEYIEIYNNTDSPRTIDRLLLRAYDPNFNGVADGADFIQTFPVGTVIPARGHFLVGDGAAYSLSTYAPLDFNTADVFNGDFFIDNEGIQIITDDGVTVLDSVGFSGSGGRAGEEVNYIEGTPIPRRTQTAPTVQYAYVRKLAGGTPQDTNNNANDFALVSVTGTTFALSAGGTTQSTLGAPGPEGTASPIQSNATLRASLIDPQQSSSAAPNRVRDATPGSGTTALGTLTLRRKFTNSGTAPVSQIRWRVADITTLGSPGGPGQADLRVISSPSGDFNVTVTGGGTVPVKGTQVEQPPTQPSGGGLNSSVVTITPATPIGPGASVNVNFTLGVVTGGSYRFFVNAEALTSSPAAAPARRPADVGQPAGKSVARATGKSTVSKKMTKKTVVKTWRALAPRAQ